MKMQSEISGTPEPQKRVGHFAFVLLERFSLLSFSSAVEVLRVANRVSGQTLYDWQLVTETGASVTCSGGTEIGVAGALEAVAPDASILVCGGEDAQRAATPRLTGWLAELAGEDRTLGGLCTGGLVLASAGLLDGYSATIHWENQESFQRRYPEVELTRSVFVQDGKRLTTAGGTAALDLMLRIVSQDHGEDLARAVADQLIYSAMRSDQDPQRLSIPTRIGVRHPKLSEVIRMMEQNVEAPLSPARLAQDVGMSTRQLERLFRRYLDRTPKRYYMEVRLQRARHLLVQTDMSVVNVALACGFSSPSHFSKCYRAHYGATPYRERGTSGPAAG